MDCGSNLVICANVENAKHRIIAEMGDLPSPKLCAGAAAFWGSTILVNLPLENWEEVSVEYLLIIDNVVNRYI